VCAWCKVSTDVCVRGVKSVLTCVCVV